MSPLDLQRNGYKGVGFNADDLPAWDLHTAREAVWTDGGGQMLFPLECPNCGGNIRLIAFRLLSESETIPGLRTLGTLRLLRTFCPRAGAYSEDSRAPRRTARASACLNRPRPTHRLRRSCGGP